MLLDELSEFVGNAMVVVRDGRGVRNRQPKPPTKQGDDLELRIRKAPQAAIVLMRLNRPCIGYRWKCEAALGFRLRP